MSTTPRLPEGPGQCATCGRPGSPLIYQGPELEAICLDCLEQVDPTRAALLRRITPGGSGRTP